LFVLSFALGLTKAKSGKQDLLKIGAVAMICVGTGVYLNKKIASRLKKENSKKQDTVIPDIKKQDKEIKKGNITIQERTFESDEATELLFDARGAQRTERCRLVSEEYPEIRVKSVPFFIGKDREHMDFCLNETGISRYHLKLDMVEGRLCIFDLNSTNGSYVNDKKIEPNMPFFVDDGDVVRLGRCSYRIKMRQSL